MTLPPSNSSPMLDEIILALQSESDATEKAPVIELAAADLMAGGGSEIVDLTNILGQGDEISHGLAGTLTEIVSVDSGSLEVLTSVEIAGPGSHSGASSILYTELSLSGDDSTSN